MKKKILLILFITFFFSNYFIKNLYSQLSPIDSLQPAMNSILQILRDKKLDTNSKKEKIKTIIYKHFDLEETAKRVMGVNWRQLTPEQRGIFIEKFRELMEYSYINKIDTYSEEDIILNNTQIQDNFAKVDGVIKGKSNSIPISFIMINNSKGWMVYDFIVENVSLVSNYRNTYNQFYSRNGFNKLIEEMDKKITELKNSRI